MTTQLAERVPEVERVTMTVPEFAARYGIPVSTVRWWVQTGKGPRSARIGSHRLFRTSDVAAWETEMFEGAPA